MDTTAVVRPLSVLLVEDHEVTAQATSLALGLFGYDVHASSNGDEALRWAGEHAPDVVLLDIAMPGMSGHDVARRLRAQRTIKRPFLVAITGHGEEEDRRRSQQAGIDLHLVKPVDLQLLAEVLDRFRAVVL